MKNNTNDIMLSDILPKKSQLLILITIQSKKKHYVTKDALIDEALDIFSEGEDSKTKVRIYQMIKELEKEGKIKREKIKNEEHIIPIVEMPFTIFNVERIRSKILMAGAVIYSWILFVISVFFKEPVLVVLIFANAFLVFISFSTFGSRFVLDLKEEKSS